MAGTSPAMTKQKEAMPALFSLELGAGDLVALGLAQIEIALALAGVLAAAAVLAAAIALAGVMEIPYRWVSSLPGRPMLTRHAVYLLAKDQEFPSDKAHLELGNFSQITFAEGMARSVAWLKELG